MSISIGVPESLNTGLKPRITVVGVGGAGGNAVNNMINSKLEGVRFVVANTDAQALNQSLAESRIQLGEKITKGLGAGANPKLGAAAAEEAINEVAEYVNNTDMLFITAGMGGGTGTGAAPIIAKAAKDQGILTIGVVTKPFNFEGPHRMRLAEKGIAELEKYVDTLIIIPNQNLFKIADEKTTFADAFQLADNVLYSGVRGITDLMIMPGLINLDFADIQTVMNEMGKAMMGTGEADGENRSIKAAEAAISNPLLENSSMKGASGVLINITGGPDMTLLEVDEAANRVRDEIENESANIIFGSSLNDALAGKIRVSVFATGINLNGSINRNIFLQNKFVDTEVNLDNEFDSNNSSVKFKSEHDDTTAQNQESNVDVKLAVQNKKSIGGFFKKLLGKSNSEKENTLEWEQDTTAPNQNNVDQDFFDKPAFLRNKEKVDQ